MGSACQGRRFCLPSLSRVRIFEAPSGGSSVSMLTAKQIQDFLKLQPLPVEGGYFFQSYRSKYTLAQPSLSACYAGERVLSTAIYYMLTPDTFSAMHRLKGDEVYHFYLGDPVEMLMLKPDGTAEAVLLGQDILAGMLQSTRLRTRQARRAERSVSELRASNCVPHSLAMAHSNALHCFESLPLDESTCRSTTCDASFISVTTRNRREVAAEVAGPLLERTFNGPIACTIPAPSALVFRTASG